MSQYHFWLDHAQFSDCKSRVDASFSNFSIAVASHKHFNNIGLLKLDLLILLTKNIVHYKFHYIYFLLLKPPNILLQLKFILNTRLVVWLNLRASLASFPCKSAASNCYQFHTTVMIKTRSHWLTVLQLTPKRIFQYYTYLSFWWMDQSQQILLLYCNYIGHLHYNWYTLANSVLVQNRFEKC